MPTDEEIKAYADKLPAIYRDVLAAFPAVAPDRRVGDGLALQTLLSHLIVEADSPYTDDDIHLAITKLFESGFLDVKRGVACYPTPLGEQLIGALTGQYAAERGIPDLPKPTW